VLGGATGGCWLADRMGVTWAKYRLHPHTAKQLMRGELFKMGWTWHLHPCVNHRIIQVGKDL